MNAQNQQKDNEMIQNDSIKEEVYQTIYKFDQVFKNSGKQIFYTKSMGYKWFFIKDNALTSDKIDDSIRIPILKNAIENSDFKNAISNNLEKKIKDLMNTLEDPISLGYLLIQDYSGKSMKSILVKRSSLNSSFDYDQSDDFSYYMSEMDYKKYHIARIHLLNDSVVFYKNTEDELSISLYHHIFYFKFIKENGKWLLDDIILCKPEEEEEFDLKLIGKSKPLKYYKAETFEFEE